MKILFMTMIAFSLIGCSIVGPGSRGVRTTFGSVSDEVKDTGFYLWIPFILGMKKINIQIQKSDIKSTAASKDMQDIHAEVAVNWSLNAKDVVKTYKEIGDEDDVEIRILLPAVNEVMKATTSKLTAEEVLTKRMQMKDDIDKGLKARLAQYGITLYDVSIVNLQFSPGFTQAIEHKQIAEQQAQQAVYVAQKATQDAIAAVEQAKGESQSTLERAKGQAKAQELLKSTLTKEMLQQHAIDKWNGNFPQVMGSGSLPFINLKMTETKGE